MASLPTPGASDVWGTQLNTAIESLHLGPDTHANRPTTGLVKNTLYSCTDHNLIYRWSGSAWATYATLGSTSAASTTFTPAGNIAAMDVQAALEEVDSEKETPAGAQAKADGAVSTHVAASDPHGDRAYAQSLLGDTSGVFVGTEESTTSSTYTALATAQTYSFTAGPKGEGLVFITAGIKSSVTTSEALMSFSMSGGGTYGASDVRALSSTDTTYRRRSVVVRIAGMTPGASCTLTAQFRATGGTATFKDRSIDVLAL